MTAEKNASPAERLLASLESGPELENYSAFEIEKAPIKEVMGRLRELGLEPARPYRVEKLLANSSPAQRIIDAIDDESANDNVGSVEALSKSEVFARLNAAGLNYLAGIERVQARVLSFSIGLGKTSLVSHVIGFCKRRRELALVGGVSIAAGLLFIIFGLPKIESLRTQDSKLANVGSIPTASQNALVRIDSALASFGIDHGSSLPDRFKTGAPSLMEQLVDGKVDNKTIMISNAVITVIPENLWVKGYDVKDGKLIWMARLPPQFFENGIRLVKEGPNSVGVFSADGRSLLELDADTGRIREVAHLVGNDERVVYDYDLSASLPKRPDMSCGRALFPAAHDAGSCSLKATYKAP